MNQKGLMSSTISCPSNFPPWVAISTWSGANGYYFKDKTLLQLYPTFMNVHFMSNHELDEGYQYSFTINSMLWLYKSIKPIRVTIVASGL
jgi:hypothetical protein